MRTSSFKLELVDSTWGTIKLSFVEVEGDSEKPP
ncbi:hypothetical protein J2750_001536 [Methanococcoides alaskense]|uniref:Uncharacterized protein n=1 Tax=Methanococcoides alaskense TaxID=325778 RepID=A0AA90U0M4_9EURY|nr:hypothetical protein [Methanococcoides alaskense]